MTHTVIQFIALTASLLGGLFFTFLTRHQFKLQNRTVFYLSAGALQMFAYFILTVYFHLHTHILQIGLVLTSSLIISCLFKKPLPKIFAIATVCTLSLFHAMGLLQPGLDVLRQIVIKIGPNSLSLLALTKALIASSFFIWSAITLSNTIESRLKKQKHLHPSMRLIFSKLFKTMLITLSIYIGFSLLGIDLSALTFFAGAIGVGIAFGLQNILSNFFCGFILLMDRSIKPGDVISIQDGKIYGVVNKLHARYVSIRTREGKEHLIPNQEIVSNKLENWSYSDPNVRIEIPFKVSYHSDLELVEKLLIDIAAKAPRVLSSYKPTIRFRTITENAVELLLRFWIADPENGMSDIRSHIILQASHAFKAHHIKIPYPPREIHSLLDELRVISETSSSASVPDK
ncbi:mechanosensitive ion channel family protein [Simkania negevensis]|uniref:MscS Mechanosensitive ion channel n=1 Tax=Simkania negevensis (strain ATCC VR-1471 / DSM 27360 / Z) TaxID=331113 RepID=F8L9I2_SIMNZ|nr:mechanosensitive ion channel domain-containing protein [Simkania negevensis]CCB89519.1 mscS Mechanosensitive ion channel [Simkania negevensis Z]